MFRPIDLRMIIDFLEVQASFVDECSDKMDYAFMFIMDKAWGHFKGQ